MALGYDRRSRIGAVFLLVRRVLIRREIIRIDKSYNVAMPKGREKILNDDEPLELEKEEELESDLKRDDDLLDELEPEDDVDEIEQDETFDDESF